MTERFTLLSELGRGGMGVVWKARDEETGQIVALKLLRETYAEDPDYVTRFERELELAKRIHSHNVVQVLGYGVRDKTPYLALEFVGGPSLRERLATHGAYSWPEAKALLVQIAQGLADAHAAGVVHRDLKPSNVLIGTDGVAKLADFGIAKGLDLTRMTGTSTLLGTPAYLPPEGPADERSDLYSLGVIAYEILTGVVPFEGRTYQEVILRHVREAPNLEKLPVEARPVVGWLLAKDPADRPRRTAELLSVLWGGAQVPVLATSQLSSQSSTPPLPTQPDVSPAVGRPTAPIPEKLPPQLAPGQSGRFQPLGAGQGQMQHGQPAAPGLASSPLHPARRSSARLAAGLGAVALVASIAAVTLAGGFLQGTASASASVPVVAVGTSTEPTGTPAPTPTPTPGFSSTGSMATSRDRHTATSLSDGRVLIAGGWSGSVDVASAELYDPKTGAFSSTGSMATSRADATATLLSDGHVLIVGGVNGNAIQLRSAETYDPATGRFSTTGSMIARPDSATLLSDGRVLVVGNRWAETYDPATGRFSTTGSPLASVGGFTATLLSDGRVLVAGGIDASGNGPLASAEIYDPATARFTKTGSMSVHRSGQTAALLKDGSVLVVGGYGKCEAWGCNDPLASAELYSPATGKFSSAGSMDWVCAANTATVLTDGRVLVAGGVNSSSMMEITPAAATYDPNRGTFSPTFLMSTARQDQTATLLADGRVLVVGGSDNGPLASAEIYTP